MRILKFFLFAVAALLAVVDPALAEAEAHAAAEAATWVKVAGGLTIAIAAFGGALAQARTAAAALESIGRNPGASGQLFTPMILGLVFIESLVIYAWVISFFLI